MVTVKLYFFKELKLLLRKEVCRDGRIYVQQPGWPVLKTFDFEEKYDKVL